MTYELIIPDPLIERFAAGDVSLMSTAAGLSTTLVDSSHDIVGSAGLVEAAGLGTNADVLEGARSVAAPTLRKGARAATDMLARSGGGVAGMPTVAVVAGVVALGAGGAYLWHRRKKTQVPTSEPDHSQPGAEKLLDEAEAVVDAEIERLDRTVQRSVTPDEDSPRAGTGGPPRSEGEVSE